MSFAPIFITVFILVCFLPMFHLHEKRIRRLKRLKVEAQNEVKEVGFRKWKKHVLRNAYYANSAAMLFSFSFIPQAFLPQQGLHAGLIAPDSIAISVIVLVLGAVACSILSLINGIKTKSIGRRLGFVKGFGWISKSKSGSELAPREVFPKEKGEKINVFDGVSEQAADPIFGCSDSFNSDESSTRRHASNRNYSKSRKVIFVAFFALFALIFVYFYSWYSEPMISGKRVSFWVNRLDDLDPSVHNEALEKLEHAETKHLRSAHDKLARLADEGSNAAAMIFYDNFGEARPEWIPNYVNHGFLPLLITNSNFSSRLDPIRELSVSHPDLVKAALRKEVARIDKELEEEDLPEWDRESRIKDKHEVENFLRRLFP